MIEFEWHKIEDIVTNKDNQRKPLNDNQRNAITKEGLYPYCGANGVVDYVDEYIFDEEILCIAEDGSDWSFNKKCTYIMNEKCWVNNHAHVVTAKSGVVLKYISYYMNYADLSSKITGTTRGKLTKSALNSIEIPLCEYEIQQKVVDILTQAQHLIDLRKEQIQACDELIKSQFIEMFGDLVRNEKGWETKTINDMCQNIFGGGTPSKAKSEYYTGEIPWVTPKDMKQLVIRDSIDHITEEAIQNSSAKLIPQGSVLMVIRSGILKRTLPVAISGTEVAVNQDMKAFIPNQNTNSSFLMYTFKLRENELLGNVRAVTADNIEFAIIKNLETPCPPIELQNQFAQFVQQVDKLKFEVEKNKNALKNFYCSKDKNYYK